eukprot:6492730-Amphidinium_carterae.6
MAPNMKLYQSSRQQRHEAIWIGRNKTTGQHITLTPEFGKLSSRTVMRLLEGQQVDKELLFRVTTLTDARHTKRTGKDEEPIPEPLFELQSRTQPTLRQRPGTIVQDWHYKPPDQPTIEQPQQPKFPEWPQPNGKHIQPTPKYQAQLPPGLEPKMTEQIVETKESFQQQPEIPQQP